jgi:hypothetical protein
MLTHATGSPEPFAAVVGAAVEYVASFRRAPNKRTTASADSRRMRGA